MCVDDASWSAFGNGQYTCAWWAANDPGCTFYQDYGQITTCPVTCNTCPTTTIPDPSDQTTYDFIDCVGDFEGDPGYGWDVCGVSKATLDKTLVRKADADFSFATRAGIGAAKPSEAIWEYTSVTTCQWDIYDQNTWTYLGSHTMLVSGVCWVGVALKGVFLEHFCFPVVYALQPDWF